MAKHEASPPLRAEDYLDQPYKLQKDLESLGALRFSPYASGLYPASDLTQELSTATGMGLAWFRDNAHIGSALYASGQRYPAIRVANSMVSVLQQNKDGLDAVVRDSNCAFRLPVRVDGDTLQSDAENRVQHDSTGYMLWLPSNMVLAGALRPSSACLEAMAQTVRYLGSLEYWQDADAGAWEEGKRIHASSIAVAMGGIRDTQRMFQSVGYKSGINFADLLQNGRMGYRRIFELNTVTLPPDGKPPKVSRRAASGQSDPVTFMGDFDISRRCYDASLLFGAITMSVFDTEESRRVISDVKNYLVRRRGIARYPGDTYWAPGFKELMLQSERTTSAPGRLEKRESVAAGVAYTGKEAQWTLFDPLLSVDAARQYLKTGSEDDFAEHLLFLNRHLGQLERQPDGTYKWPENRYYEFTPHTPGQTYTLRPNDHTPLLWTQANSLIALRYFSMIATHRKMARE